MSARFYRLDQYITCVLAKHPGAKYVLLQGLWYIREGEIYLSYGQLTPYKAWKNAAERLRRNDKQTDGV